MTNNDVLRRLRFIFDFDDATMIKIFALAGAEVRRGHIISWLLKEDENSYQECNDKMLATFLNGLINEKRGKRDGPQPKAEHSLTNNLILKKLKIALNLQSDDIIKILHLADYELMLIAGGMEALRTSMLVGALPFSLIMGLMGLALIKALIEDAFRNRVQKAND